MFCARKVDDGVYMSAWLPKHTCICMYASANTNIHIILINVNIMNINTISTISSQKYSESEQLVYVKSSFLQIKNQARKMVLIA